MTTARSVTAEVSPKLGELSADVLFGDVWERPELSKRDRSMITVASLIALYRTDQLRGHLGRALDNGRNEGGNLRNHLPHGLLRRLAYRCQCRPRRKGGLRRAPHLALSTSQSRRFRGRR